MRSRARDGDVDVRQAASEALRLLESRFLELDEAASRAGSFEEWRETKLDAQSAAAQFELASLAVRSPLAVLGTCEQDGSGLRFVGRSSGLYVCCSAAPRHCWRIGS